MANSCGCVYNHAVDRYCGVHMHVQPCTLMHKCSLRSSAILCFSFTSPLIACEHRMSHFGIDSILHLHLILLSGLQQCGRSICSIAGWLHGSLLCSRGLYNATSPQSIALSSQGCHKILAGWKSSFAEPTLRVRLCLSSPLG